MKLEIYITLGVMTFFVGCSNVSTTRFTYLDPSGTSVTIEMPKEVEATDLKVFINAVDGTASIEAREWVSTNAETILAQSEREKQSLEKIAKGAAEGAASGLSPIPKLPFPLP